ncbi:three-finger toxin A2-like [Ambystoma mexicanum]|uniref:three-finger toxin A2-like n=1 Tax=Ambystoma mexicanum TaxID=8296 RepID=UPI0037E8206F
MKALLLTLLAAALCVGLADSLTCYTCTAAMADSSCMTNQTCPFGMDYCETIIGKFMSVWIMTKRCASSCVNGHQNLILADTTQGCCNTNLCNNQKLGNVNSDFAISGATGVKINALVPLALVAFLAALLKMGQ